MNAKPPPVPKAPRLLWILLLLGVIVAVPALLVGLKFSAYKRSHREAIARLEGEIRARGEPLTLQELAESLRPVPDSENGAVEFMNLWERDDPDFWKAFRSGADEVPARSKPVFDPNLPFLGEDAGTVKRRAALTPEQRAAADAYAPELERRIAEVQRILGYSRFQFKVDLTNGLSATLPHIPELRREMQRLQLAALLALERGAVSDSLDCLALSAAIADTLKDDPLLISALVRRSAAEIHLRELERILSRSAPDSGQLERMTRLVAASPSIQEWGRILTTERVTWTSYFKMEGRALAELLLQEQATNRGAATGMQMGMEAFRFAGFRDADHRLMLETFDQARLLAERNDVAALLEASALFERASATASSYPPRFFSAVFLPSQSRPALRFAAFEARRRCAETALAVESYRLRNAGRLPVDLEMLVPEYLPQLPADPFNGEALRFKADENQYAIYSVGENRRDDGGRDSSGQGASSDWDLAFTVEMEGATLPPTSGSDGFR